jgi:uncharacterized protein (DUF2267 family)
MDYQDFIDEILDMGFVQDEDTADAIVKAVLGILASRIDEPQARLLVDSLPDPLTLDRLRGYQELNMDISADEYFDVIAEQFDLDRDQAERVVERVFEILKDGIDVDTLLEIEECLPSDWVAVIERS